MKIYKVKNCSMCRLQTQAHFNESYCRLIGRVITVDSFNESVHFPDWCPLEDAPEGE